MKKMISIITLLVLIFVGLAIYKFTLANNNQIKIQDVNNIEEYISKIYCWKEITNNALPEFDNINNAPSIWILEVVKKNSEEFELSKEDINSKAKEIFGENYNKNDVLENQTSFIYDEHNNKYIATEVNTDEEDDSFFVNKIEKVDNGYKVEVLEYLEDYTDYEKNKIYIKNINGDTIETIDTQNVEYKTIEVLKNNREKFLIKNITLKINNEKIYIEKVEGK